MHSARKEPDRTCRTKFLRISCAQVGDVRGQACHRSVYLQIFQFQLFLTMVWMLWIQLGHCQQWWKMCCLQDLVYLLLLNQLWNHCTDIVQSTKKCFGEQNNKLPYKSNFWVITKTTAKRKNFQQFCEISFVLYLHIFSVFFPSDRISGCVMLFLVASEKTKENPDFYLACTMPCCRVSPTQTISVILILSDPEIRSVTPLKLSPAISPGSLERYMPFHVKSVCFVQPIVWLVTWLDASPPPADLAIFLLTQVNWIKANKPMPQTTLCNPRVYSPSWPLFSLFCPFFFSITIVTKNWYTL